LAYSHSVQLEGHSGWHKYYICDRCKESIFEAHPHYRDDTRNYHLCWDCGFIQGEISEKEYLSCCGVFLKGARAAVIDDEVVIYVGKAPWERTDKNERQTLQYKEWRTKVFQRDEYTCQHCGQVGGELNAHHIKPFAKYKKLRYDVKNGLTLCLECHKQEHRKEKKR
jgi:5-methylcytosine-specific restriction endonuclease McrA